MKEFMKKTEAVIFLAVLFILPLLTLFSHKESFSELENRTLQSKPDFSFDSWFDKSFMDKNEAQS